MEIQVLILAYTAAALVALAVTAAFSPSLESMLFRVLPGEVSEPWARFVKFAVFVSAFAGGAPSRVAGLIDRNVPNAPPPGAAEGFTIVMSSAIGALMAASWVLLALFAIASAVLLSGRAYGAYRARGEPVKRLEPAEPRPVSSEKPAAPAPRRR